MRKSINGCTDGVAREVYLINDQQPGPLIEVDEGDELEVFVKNNLIVETTIHWHGQYAMSGTTNNLRLRRNGRG